MSEVARASRPLDEVTVEEAMNSLVRCRVEAYSEGRVGREWCLADRRAVHPDSK